MRVKTVTSANNIALYRAKMYNWISVEKMIESFGQAYGMEWIEQYYIKTEEQILQSAKKNSSRTYQR